MFIHNVSFLIVFLLSTFHINAIAKDRSRLAENNLEFQFAKSRKSQIENVEYHLFFQFQKNSSEFSSKAKIDVTLKNTKIPLSLDFSNGKILTIKVNGEAVSDYEKREGSFDIPAKYLKQKNQIEVEYVGNYSNEGTGFQKFVDPEDKEEYIYSDSEPYYAHTFFPCFDQPDIKAIFHLQVVAPKDWKVISNDLIETTVNVDQGMETKFHPTKLISPYLFFLGLGAFQVWEDTTLNIPLTIYARKTMAKYVDAPRIFETTKKGIKFYTEYFATPFPFTKYGQIFIPEFAWGGMENPGAVTLNERGLFRGPKTQSEYEGRDDLILHEMAHMWFGDFVTMEWWDDLWLNESFATYLASISGARALGNKGVDIESVSTKSWGYWQDQLKTTHPIETPVKDTRTAKGNFDGITYAKGGASLKQLHFFVGEDAFREGLRSYFKKYGYKNAKRKDFIDEIANASKMKLDIWTKKWLQTAGPNRTQVNWDCKDKKIKTFEIEQFPSTSGTLSPHKTKIGLFKLVNGKFELMNSQDVVYDKKKTDVKEVMGKDCPDFVFPNLGDEDYSLYSLDAKSLKLANQVLAGDMNNPLIRMMTWQILAQMVYDGNLLITEYFEMALKGLETESDDSVISVLLGRQSNLYSYYYDYLTPIQRDLLSNRLESVIWERVQKSEPKSNLQMSFFNFYISISHSPEGINLLSEILNGKNVPKGLEIDQDKRWNIIRHSAMYGLANAGDVIAKELQKDTSVEGKKQSIAAKLAIPELSAKENFWKTLVDRPDELSNSTLRAATTAFHNPNKPEMTMPLIDDYFKQIGKIDWSANDALIKIYFQRLFPVTLCSPDVLKKSVSYRKKAKNLTDLARRSWIEVEESLEKCIYVRGKVKNIKI